MAKHIYNLGDKLKDEITGFEGIAIAKTKWLHNCNTYLLKPTELKDGIPQESQSFDEPQLSLVEKQKIKESPEPKTGGPTEKIEQTNKI